MNVTVCKVEYQVEVPRHKLAKYNSFSISEDWDLSGPRSLLSRIKYFNSEVDNIKEVGGVISFRIGASNITSLLRSTLLIIEDTLLIPNIKKDIIPTKEMTNSFSYDMLLKRKNDYIKIESSETKLEDIFMKYSYRIGGFIYVVNNNKNPILSVITAINVGNNTIKLTLRRSYCE